MEIIQIGNATKNQVPQPGCGLMYKRATRFWGEAMGDAAPPMLEARAIPSKRAFDMLLSAGRLRRIGYDVVSLISRMLGILSPHLNDGEA